MNTEAVVSRQQADRLVRAFRPDLRLVRVWPIAGAVSSQVCGIEVEGAGGFRCTLVLRRYGAANVEAMPRIADNEYRLLTLLSAAGLPVPRPLLVDESGAVVPGSCLLMEFIDGRRVNKPADLPSFTRQLAAALAAVHDCGITRAEVAFLPDMSATVWEELRAGPHSIDSPVPEAAIRQILRANWPPPRVFPLEALPLPADEIASMRRAHREFALAAMRQL